MHQIKGVTKGVFGILAASINHFRPKTDDDYFASANTRKEFRKLLKEGGSGGPEDMLIDDDKPAVMQFEDADFRFLEKAFKAARESGEVYLPMGAEFVVTAMDCVKNAEKVKKEAVDDPGNGSKATNRVEKATAQA